MPSGDLSDVTRELETRDPHVLIFVGSGITIGATSAPQASWEGLLMEAVRFLEEAGWFGAPAADASRLALADAFRPFQLEKVLEVAEFLVQNMDLAGAREKSEWLARVFRQLRSMEGRDAALLALRDLQAGGALLLTTNYDSLLSEVTGLPPVTWLELDAMKEVAFANRPGVLHLHGHWNQPESLVLSRSSYERITSDENVQDFLKLLWLNWVWVVVGCGEGLADPNLGPLLQWASRFNAGRSGFFIGLNEVACTLGARGLGAKALQARGYRSHKDLPQILEELLPEADPTPFVPVSEDLWVFRADGSQTPIPFPSYQEYRSGVVPAFAADAIVSARLGSHGWAFVRGRPSVGKTTLAMRIAVGPDRRTPAAFYLDFTEEMSPEFGAEVEAALRRLAYRRCLLILDNVHRQPELARRIWCCWHAMKGTCQLLVLATEGFGSIFSNPAEDLGFFEAHVENPTIVLRPEPCDLAAIVRYLDGRVPVKSGHECAQPPDEVLIEWHRRYGGMLGAFCITVMSQLRQLRKGDWALPLDVATEWMSRHWLKRVNSEGRENLECIAAFAACGLELQVPIAILPHPNAVEQLHHLIQKNSDLSPLSERRVSLLDLNWGRLLLEALGARDRVEQLCFSAASRRAALAAAVLAVFHRQGKRAEMERFWKHLSANPGDVLHDMARSPLPAFTAQLNVFRMMARPGLPGVRLPESGVPWGGAMIGPSGLLADCWSLRERDAASLVLAIADANFNAIAGFVAAADQDFRDVAALWAIVLSPEARLKERLLSQTLTHITGLLRRASESGGDVEPLWRELLLHQEWFVERAVAGPIGDSATLLECAQQSRFKVEPLWVGLEANCQRIIAAAKGQPLDQTVAFLRSAGNAKRDVELFWSALEREPEWFVTCVREAPFDKIIGFMRLALEHGREVQAYWEALAAQAPELSGLEDDPGFINLVALCRQAPPEVARQLLCTLVPRWLGGLDPGHPMVGAGSVAAECLRLGLEDVGNSLLGPLLERADPRDFPARSTGSCVALARLLEWAARREDARIPMFVRCVCTPEWLADVYAWETSGAIASALRNIGLHQSAAIRKHFCHSQLRGRLATELLEFSSDELEAQSRTLQLLGGAVILGLFLPRRLFTSLRFDHVWRVVREETPHRPEATVVEDWAYQLWVGIWFAAGNAGQPLRVCEDDFRRTLELWRENLRLSRELPGSRGHEIDETMVAWLEHMLANFQRTLPPADLS